jgi:hypothetical protein
MMSNDRVNDIAEDIVPEVTLSAKEMEKDIGSSSGAEPSKP